MSGFLPELFVKGVVLTFNHMMNVVVLNNFALNQWGLFKIWVGLAHA